jgi:putative FmdB family regulatory protein
MPIYTYKCNNCKKIFDEFVLSTCNGEEILCSDCNSSVSRVFSPVGIIFKGKGFYSTDYGAKTKNIASSENGKDSSDKSKDKSETVKTENKKQTSKDNSAPKDKISTK